MLLAGWDFQPHHTLPSQEREKKLEVKPRTNSQWLKQLFLCKGASIKILRRFRDLPGWWTQGGARRVAYLEVYALSPIFCIMHLFHLVVPELYSFIVNHQSSKWTVFLSSVSHSSRLSNLRAELQKLPIYNLVGQKLCVTWESTICNWHLRLGVREQSLKNWALNLWDLRLTPGKQCQNWTEEHSAGVGKLAGMGKPYMSVHQSILWVLFRGNSFPLALFFFPFTTMLDSARNHCCMLLY